MDKNVQGYVAGVFLIGAAICLHIALTPTTVQDTGKTRIMKQVFADRHVEYKAQYQVSTWFGMSNWRNINGNSLQCIQIKWSEDEPKRIIRDYSEEKALGCEQTRIDQWLAERKSEQIVSSEYIKYP